MVRTRDPRVCASSSVCRDSGATQLRVVTGYQRGYIESVLSVTPRTSIPTAGTPVLLGVISSCPCNACPGPRNRAIQRRFGSTQPVQACSHLWTSDVGAVGDR